MNIFDVFSQGDNVVIQNSHIPLTTTRNMEYASSNSNSNGTKKERSSLF